MRFNIRGQKIEVTDAIRNYVQEKIGKLDKYFNNPTEISANVLLKVTGRDQTVEVTIPAVKLILRGEVTHDDLYAAIDLVVEKIERQIRKYKTRSSVKAKKTDFMNFINVEVPKEEIGEENTIVKRKAIEMKPMSEEEAILQMEMLGHEFFVFKGIDRESLSVLYKRKDGNYGIIETK